MSRDTTEAIRFMVLLKAILLDQSNPTQVSDFNQAVQTLQDLQTGTKRKQKTPEDVNNIMRDFQKNYLKPRMTKLKNFERDK